MALRLSIAAISKSLSGASFSSEARALLALCVGLASLSRAHGNSITVALIFGEIADSAQPAGCTAPFDQQYFDEQAWVHSYELSGPRRQDRSKLQEGRTY